MRKLHLLSVLALAAAIAPAAHAAHITCNNSSQVPNADLLGYDFTIDAPVSNTGGGGAGVGKVTTSLSITLPVDASTVALSQIATTGKHTSSCVITDPSSPIELVLSDVIFTKFEVVNGPDATGKTFSVVQVTLSYSKYALTSQ